VNCRRVFTVTWSRCTNENWARQQLVVWLNEISRNVWESNTTTTHCCWVDGLMGNVENYFWSINYVKFACKNKERCFLRTNFDRLYSYWRTLNTTHTRRYWTGMGVPHVDRVGPTSSPCMGAQIILFNINNGIWSTITGHTK
jgi:hypothetical protein